MAQKTKTEREFEQAKKAAIRAAEAYGRALRKLLQADDEEGDPEERIGKGPLSGEVGWELCEDDALELADSVNDGFCKRVRA